jgi:hypothetical protein
VPKRYKCLPSLSIDFRCAICAVGKVSDFQRSGWQRLGHERSPRALAGRRRRFAIQYLPVRHFV